MSAPDHSPGAGPWPVEAEALFGDRLRLASAYADLLATEGVVRGLVGPREVGRIWDRHVVNSALLSQAVPVGETVCDVGSGAGLPGLVLAIARPDLRVTLVEPLLRRTVFLQECVDELGLDTVEVVRGRADALHGTLRADVVTSRAVAPLERLLGWSMPLVGPHGALVAMKGSSIHDEIAAARPVLAALGCAEPEVVQVAVGSAEATLVRVAWADPGRVSSGAATDARRSSRTRSPARARRRS